MSCSPLYYGDPDMEDRPYIRDILHYHKTGDFPEDSRMTWLTATQLSQALDTARYVGISNKKFARLVDEYVWRLGASELDFLKVFAFHYDSREGAVSGWYVIDRNSELAQKFPGIYSDISLHARYMSTTPGRYIEACRLGNLRLLNYYDRCGYPVPADALRAAIRGGHRDCVQWLHDHGAIHKFHYYNGNHNDLYYAIECQHIDIMNLLMTYGAYEINNCIIDKALSGNTDIIKWICARDSNTAKMFIQ